jgi:hypothetical protein
VRKGGLPVRRGRAARPLCLFRAEDRRYLRNGEEAEQLFAEISAINAELLARREIS